MSKMAGRHGCEIKLQVGLSHVTESTKNVYRGKEYKREWSISELLLHTKKSKQEKENHSVPRLQY